MNAVLDNHKVGIGLHRVWLTLMTLVAFLAVYLLDAHRTYISPALPSLLAIALLSYIVPFRLSKNFTRAIVIRVIVLSFLIITNRHRAPIEQINMFDVRTTFWVGNFAMAELTIRHWMRLSHREFLRWMFGLTGLAMLSASSTMDDQYFLFLMPVYSFALFMVLQWSVHSTEGLPKRAFRINQSFALGLSTVLFLSATCVYIIVRHRDAIALFGSRMLSGTMSESVSGLSAAPSLRQVTALREDPSRVMLVDGQGDMTHLRGIAFDVYRASSWLPTIDRRNFELIPYTTFDITAEDSILNITRLGTQHSTVFFPLHCAGLRFHEPIGLYYDKTRSTLRSDAPLPDTYSVLMKNEENHQGVFCQPPAAEERQRLMFVAEEIDPQIRELAFKITKDKFTIEERVLAIQDYLISNHSYSLDFRSGKEEPLSKFLLEKQSAHCELFATAATILCRYAGVPARYVVGYYGHEVNDKGQTVIRQRDAHAWSEYWVDGKGWYILETTPGDGLPSQTATDIPPFERFKEWVQDHSLVLQAWVSRNWQKVLALVLSLALPGLLVYRWLKKRRLALQKARDEEFHYSQPSNDIRLLGQRFQKVALRFGIQFPQSSTWGNHLLQLANNAETSRIPLQAMQGFVDLYTRANFGDKCDVASTERMNQLLVQLENTTIEGRSTQQ